MSTTETAHTPDIRDARSFHDAQDLQQSSAGDTHGDTGRTEKRRVLLKLSGEVFGGGKVGVDPETVRGIGQQIADARGQVEIATSWAEATSSVARSSPRTAWTVAVPTTWACSAP